MSTLPTHPRRAVSNAGREILAAAVRINHDWSLRASSEDMLIAALEGLPDEDLEGASLLAGLLQEAIACVEIRRRAETQPGHPDGWSYRREVEDTGSPHGMEARPGVFGFKPAGAR